MEMVPSGLQNFAEWLVEGLFNFLESVMGTDLTKKTFWFFGSIFIFILLTNWFGLIPGIGTVGHMDSEGHFVPYLRGGNADLNMTFALAMAFFVVWFIWAIQENGVVGFFKHIFMPQRAHFLIAAIFIFVGLVEVISIFMRPVALSFRLYGNVFAGENLLETMIHKAGWLAPLIPLPFYFLELLVGIIQATVFMLLTALFTKIICSHEGDHHDHGHEDDHHHGEAVEAAEGSAQH
jgi:F-type H+-transporting ATPase subunit a